MATDKPRFSLTLDEATLSKVLAYQKQHGLATKSKAIQSLVQSGLEDYKKISPGPNEPGDDVKELIPVLRVGGSSPFWRASLKKPGTP